MGATSYFAETEETAWKEVVHRWNASPESYRMVEVELSVDRVVDLTDPAVREEHGMEGNDLVGDDYTLCQELANRLRRKGVQAIRTYSRANRPDGKTWVVFLECLHSKPDIKIRRKRAVRVRD